MITRAPGAALKTVIVLGLVPPGAEGQRGIAIDAGTELNRITGTNRPGTRDRSGEVYG
jgi:hypothetical protein